MIPDVSQTFIVVLKIEGHKPNRCAYIKSLVDYEIWYETEISGPGVVKIQDGLFSFGRILQYPPEIALADL